MSRVPKIPANLYTGFFYSSLYGMGKSKVDAEKVLHNWTRLQGGSVPTGVFDATVANRFVSAGDIFTSSQQLLVSGNKVFPDDTTVIASNYSGHNLLGVITPDVWPARLIDGIKNMMSLSYEKSDVPPLFYIWSKSPTAVVSGDVIQRALATLKLLYPKTSFYMGNQADLSRLGVNNSGPFLK